MLRGRRRWDLPVLLAGAVSLAALLASAAPAQAAAGPHVGPVQAAPARPAAAIPAGAVPVRMGLNCTTMSAAARTYAVEHDLCPTGVTPHTTVWGSCGSAWAYIYDDVLGDRLGRFDWGTYSILGVIVYRNLQLAWTFTAQGAGSSGGGTILDSGFWFNSWYEAVGTLYTDAAGAASVRLTGTVTLVWGGVCEVLPPFPTDFKPVT
jgi:hypothetical protein